MYLSNWISRRITRTKRNSILHGNLISRIVIPLYTFWSQNQLIRYRRLGFLTYLYNIPCLQFRFGSIVPKNTNKLERDVTENKKGLFYSEPTLPSLLDFCNSFSNGNNQLNSANASFRTKKMFFKRSQIT